MQWWIIHALSAHPSTYPTNPLTHPHLGVSNHSNGIILELIERIWFCLQIYDLWKHTTHTTHRSQSLASEIMSFNHSPVVQFFWVFFFLENTSPFLWGNWYPCFGILMMSPLCFKARVGSLICVYWRHTWYTFPEIYLWCNTCWSLGGQHCSQAILFHIPVSKHWWGLKLGPIVPPLTVWDSQVLY